MASEINRLKAVFETNNGSTSNTSSKPLPPPPSSRTERPVQVTNTTSPNHKSSLNVGGSSSSVKIKPISPLPARKLPGRSESLPKKSAPPSSFQGAGGGTPSVTTKAEAALHLAAVLKVKSHGVAGNNGSSEVVAGSRPVHSSPPSIRRANNNDLRKDGVHINNGVAISTSSSPKSITGAQKTFGCTPKPISASSKTITSTSPKTADLGVFKTLLKPVVVTGPKMSVTSPGKPGTTHKSPLSPSKEGGSVSFSSSSGVNGTSSSSASAASVFGVTLSHRDNNDRGTPHSSSSTTPSSSSSTNVKPMQPPSPFNVKLRSTSVNTSSNESLTNATTTGTSSRDERSNSVPRDVELSESDNQFSRGKKKGALPNKRPLSIDAPQVSPEHVGKDLKTRMQDGSGNDQRNRPRPPPKKSGSNTVGDKPSPPPKPPSGSTCKSPSKALPKPPVSSLKKNTKFNRVRAGSTPDSSSRESTPNLEADSEDRESRSRSALRGRESSRSRVSDGFLEETLKALDDRQGLGGGTKTRATSWVIVDEHSNSATWKGGPKNLNSKKALPKTPPRVKSSESTGSSDGPKCSSSVSALQSKFGDLCSAASSPPASPASPLGRTPGKLGENKFSSSLAPDRGGRSNADSGFISEVPDDLSTVGHSTSNDNISETLETPPTPLSPDSQPEEHVVEVWDDARLEKAQVKRSNIARELLETEKTYVSRLKLIAEDFYDVVKQFSEKSKDAEVMQIFLNIQQIHQLNQTILQSLETRIDSWSSEERLGDVICRLAPFLKLYSHYTSGFEEAMKTLTECTKKDKKFDAIVRDFERTTISTGLGVAHYMLEPIQRIPRYKLLLLDYLKYLPPDSPDRPDTEKALGIISEAADRNNDRIKELEISNEILSIQRSLSDYNEMLLQPSRVFIKKGTLQKMSRKNLTQRMFFLFSDVLLHTYPAHNGVYKFKDEMALCEMHIQAPTVSLFPHSFEVHCTARSLLLVATSEEEKNEWMEALDAAINNDIKKRRSLRRQTFVMKRSQMKKFGYKAPIMVPDKSVSMCQVCSNEFTVLFRRHHCRACGKVVCSNCSQKKAYLHYLQKHERICEACYKEYLKQSASDSLEDTDGGSNKTSSPRQPKRQESAPAGVLNLKAYDRDAVIAGYVLTQEGRKFNRVWYQVKQDFVLYKFRAHEDIKAYHSLPLPGYEVKSDSKSCTIHLLHPSKKKELGDTFRVEDSTAFTNWSHTLEKVVRMEIPSPTHQDQRDSRCSQSLEDSVELCSRPDSFESYSSGSFDEDSPESVRTVEQRS